MNSIVLKLYLYTYMGNGTPPLCNVPLFEINNENDFSLIDLICTMFENFPRRSVSFKG